MSEARWTLTKYDNNWWNFENEEEEIAFGVEGGTPQQRKRYLDYLNDLEATIAQQQARIETLEQAAIAQTEIRYLFQQQHLADTNALAAEREHAQAINESRDKDDREFAAEYEAYKGTMEQALTTERERVEAEHTARLRADEDCAYYYKQLQAEREKAADGTA
jgi:hypothetical protein